MDLIQHYAITSKENKSLKKDTATQFKGSSPGHCLEEDMHFSALKSGVANCRAPCSMKDSWHFSR